MRTSATSKDATKITQAPRRLSCAVASRRATCTRTSVSRDTIYGPERSGEFYVRGERVYLSRRALARAPTFPAPPAANLAAYSATWPECRAHPAPSPIACPAATSRPSPPATSPSTGRFTAAWAAPNSLTDGANSTLRSPVGDVSARLQSGNGRGDVSAQLAKGEFRIIGNLIYGPPGHRVPWLTALASTVVEPTTIAHAQPAPSRSACNGGSIRQASTRQLFAARCEEKTAWTGTAPAPRSGVTCGLTRRNDSGLE
jgi:hypothetical protein